MVFICYLMCISDLIKLLLLFAHSCCLLRVIIKTFISRLGQVISIKLNQACLNEYVMVLSKTTILINRKANPLLTKHKLYIATLLDCSKGFLNKTPTLLRVKADETVAKLSLNRLYSNKKNIHFKISLLFAPYIVRDYI